MSKKAANRNGTPTRQGVDLEKLRQCDAAWMIDKPASWLRNNSNLVRRNSDGSYDGQKLVQAFAEHGFQAAALNEEDLEAVKDQAAKFALYIEPTWPLMLDMLRNVDREYGAAGMAVVGKCFMESLEKLAKRINFKFPL